PDHDTIADFRQRFLPQLAKFFVQILEIAHETGVLKLGSVSLDGIRVKANASKHSALSYEYASRLEKQLMAEIAELFKKAESADQAAIPDGMNIPEELARREERLKAIVEAKAEIDRRAKERHATEQEAYERKMTERSKKDKPKGSPPRPPEAGPAGKDQVNLTDGDSRIMPGGGGFELVRKMQALDLKPDIIFVTAFSQYAIEAIRASAFDYILKPIDEAQLRKAVNRLRCQRKQMGGRGIGQLVEELRKPARLRVNVRSGFLMLEPAEILYLEADGSYTDIYMCNGRHELTSTNLSQILDQLPARDFLRISRSLCINLAYLTRIDRNKHCCILQEGEKKYELHVSRRYFSRIDEATQ
ncbi:MAG TPA: LytTR family transcriptional regulator DNA-binding domain-containing protein, partial [Bacteroidales bacterium]|nr:LytTR family transcriptional regulator DNA-binding domain-containing protein [Bacteroidales bacterium]